MKLDWDDLRVFLSIIETGNLSAASRLLNVSQPTVGRRLKSLESSLGTPLFDRLPDGLALTTYGERFAADFLQPKLLSSKADASLDRQIFRLRDDFGGITRIIF